MDKIYINRAKTCVRELERANSFPDETDNDLHSQNTQYSAIRSLTKGYRENFIKNKKKVSSEITDSLDKMFTKVIDICETKSDKINLHLMNHLLKETLSNYVTAMDDTSKAVYDKHMKKILDRAERDVDNKFNSDSAKERGHRMVKHYEDRLNLARNKNKEETKRVLTDTVKGLEEMLDNLA